MSLDCRLCKPFQAECRRKTGFDRLPGDLVFLRSGNREICPAKTRWAEFRSSTQMILPYTAIVLLVVATLYSTIVSFRRADAGKRTWVFPEATNRSARIVVGGLTLALLTGLAVWLGVGARNSTRPASRFLIPDGYTGWVRIEFEVQGAPPLPMEGGEYILKIPPDGLLRTSSAEQYGWAKDHYYYYSAQAVHPLPDSGSAALIWGKINGEGSGASGKRKYEELFVGTEQQFKSQVPVS